MAGTHMHGKSRKRGTFEHLQTPGLVVPGPPVQSMECEDSEDGLIVTLRRRMAYRLTGRRGTEAKLYPAIGGTGLRTHKLGC